MNHSQENSRMTSKYNNFNTGGDPSIEIEVGNKEPSGRKAKVVGKSGRKNNQKRSNNNSPSNSSGKGGHTPKQLSKDLPLTSSRLNQ